MSPVPGVFSFEGDWEHDLADKKSVRPLLETIDRVQGVRFIHRRIGTLEELDHYLDKWLQKGYSRYRIGIFSTHGTPGHIQFGNNNLTLEQLGDRIDGRAKGRVIYFDTCSTLRLGDDRIEAFRKATDADAVIGFTRDVGWTESAAFLLLLLQAFCERTRLHAVENWLATNYTGAIDRLGLKFATR